MKRAVALLVAAAVCWGGALLVQARALDIRAEWPPTEEYHNIPSADMAPFMAVGYREFAADCFWAMTLVYYGGSRRGKDDYRYLERFIDVVISLDPSYRRVYEWASAAVTFKQNTVTQEELYRSLKYLELGMKRFPDTYWFLWRAGLIYSMDLRNENKAKRRADKLKGAELIERGMRKKDAPVMMVELAAGLNTALGRHQRAIRNLQEIILTAADDKTRETLLQRLRNSYQEPDLADGLRRATKQFVDSWSAAMPYATPEMYILVGDEPSPVIDFDKLATERDLFGVDLEKAEPPEE